MTQGKLRALIAALSERVHQAAEALVVVVLSQPHEQAVAGREFATLEADCAAICRRLVQQLRDTKPVPEDGIALHAAATSLKEAFRRTQRALEHVRLQPLPQCQFEILRLARLLVRTTFQMTVAASDSAELPEAMVRMHRLRRQSGRLARRVIAELPEREPDVLVILRCRSIAEATARAVDAVERAAVALHRVVVIRLPHDRP
jgi:hypothetical protein